MRRLWRRIAGRLATLCQRRDRHALPDSRPQRPYRLRTMPGRHAFRRDVGTRRHAGGVAADHRPVRRRGRQLYRHSQCLRRRPVGGDRRQRPCRPPRPDRRCHQSAVPGRRSDGQRRGIVAWRRAGSGGQQPTQARHRLHRPLLPPRAGPADPDRRDAGGARRHRPGRQGPPSGAVELSRLASNAGHDDRLGSVRRLAVPIQSGMPRYRA